MKEYPVKRFLELGWFTEDDIGKDKFDELISNSTPTKENFIRISSVVSLPSIFYNFKLQTKSKTAYFCICSALIITAYLIWKQLVGLQLIPNMKKSLIPMQEWKN